MKNNNGIDGIALRTLIPDEVSRGIKLNEWDDFILLGQENLIRFVRFWRKRERAAKKQINKWESVIGSVKTGIYPVFWSKGDQIDEDGCCKHPYCYKCRYGVYYSHCSKKGETAFFTCGLRTEMGFTKLFSTTPLSVDRKGACRIAYEPNERQREKTERKAAKLMSAAIAKRQRIANKIAILEHMISLTKGESAPVLPCLRHLDDFSIGKEVGEVTDGLDHEIRRWRVSRSFSAQDTKVPVFTFRPGGVTRVDDSITPQDPKYAMAQDVIYMKSHPRFAELWLSSIRNDGLRYDWRNALRK